jgi:hypothetical protein
MSTAIEDRARRAAKRIGSYATKSRSRLRTIDNYGQFMLINLYRNCVLAGERFNLSPEDVIACCAKRTNERGARQ